MIIIFDTMFGLCNQIWDIVNAIDFCLKNNIEFSFRYCSYRKEDLKSWFCQDFTKLFNDSFLKENQLYIDFKNLSINKDNTFNYEGKYCHFFIDGNKNVLEQLKKINKKYIVLGFFRSVYNCDYLTKVELYKKILPSDNLMNIYNIISNKLFNKEKYNFIHYRYEKDFTDFFNVKIENLDKIIDNISKKFKNNYKIYIATTNIKSLINTDNYKNILFKDENDKEFENLNFEEKALIDFLIGKNSEEVFGHSKSSFSQVLNSLKGTKNYYD